MVRNLVLTPFIDPAYPHFMFSREKYLIFLAHRNSQETDARVRLSWIIFFRSAPIDLLMGHR